MWPVIGTEAAAWDIAFFSLGQNWGLWLHKKELQDEAELTILLKGIIS